MYCRVATRKQLTDLLEELVEKAMKENQNKKSPKLPMIQIG